MGCSLKQQGRGETAVLLRVVRGAFSQEEAGRKILLKQGLEQWQYRGGGVAQAEANAGEKFRNGAVLCTPREEEGARVSESRRDRDCAEGSVSNDSGTADARSQ